jgi:DNA (cytosine-5)-methyltransferase 1
MATKIPRKADSIVLPDLVEIMGHQDGSDLYDLEQGPYDLYEDEIAIDLFCGAGGTSTGIRDAIGESPMFALNHNPVALGVHDLNHPDTIHLESDVFAMNPADHVPHDKRVGILCASPSCVHFSTARGGKPLDREIRDQAWVVCNWAEHPDERFRPRGIMIENVREFLTWCPVDDKGKIIKKFIDKNKLGSIFKEWRARLVAAGYVVEFKILNAADYGVGSKRRRLLIMARRDGLPIRFPKPTHGPRDSQAVKDGLLKPYSTAAEHIDFTIKAHPIFMYAEDAKKVGCIRPLADNTLRRVAAGVERFVIEAAEPYIIPYYGAKAGENSRAKPVSEPLPTQTTENRFAFVNPVISPITHTGAPRYYGMGGQLPTLTCAKRGELALISPICSMEQDGAAVIPMRRECSPVGMGDPLPALATHSQMALAVGGFVECTVTGFEVTGGEYRGDASPFLVGAGGGEYAGKPRTADDALNTVTCHSRQAVVEPRPAGAAADPTDLERVRSGVPAPDADRPHDRRSHHGHDRLRRT